MTDKIICKICEKEFKNIQCLSNHIRLHLIKPKNYYDQFLKKENEGICYCRNNTSFINMCSGYHTFCCAKCVQLFPENQIKIRNTNLKRYGQNEKIIFTEIHKLNLSNIRIGKKHLFETKLKMSNSHKGKIFSEQHKLHLRGKSRNKGRQDSLETKKKKSIAAIKRMEKNGLDCFPYEGNNEKYILNLIQNSIGLEILKNDRKLSQRIKGKSCDGYLVKYNLPIEILEKHHFKADGELKEYDKKRELIISSNLNCMVYYIPEQEFLSNSEKEIQRLKDFLILLDQGRN
jgi:hypothetical protein